jgi:hypothetical protein
MTRVHRYFPIITVSLISAIAVVLKAFLVKDCWAFDNNDDANHTFPNLFIARNALRLGEIPQINVFNNFGSPLLGDALTYPFGIHSLTYWFFASPIAMTINRFIFAGLTIFLGYLFFKKQQKEFSSILCSFWVFFSAVNLWFFATYHMQLALFFEFSLLVINQYSTQPRFLNSLIMFAVCAVMMLSLSINLSILILALLIASQLIDDRFRISKKSILIVISILSALIVTVFQSESFIRAMINSSRLHNHYSELATFDLKLLLARILIYVSMSVQRWHPDSTVFLSIPVVFSTIMGLFILYKKKNPVFQKAFLLGILIPLVSYTLMIFPSIWWRIPLLNTTDLTRVIWLALPFMFLAVGAALDWLNDLSFSRAWPKTVLVLICVIFWVGEYKSATRILGLDGLRVCKNTHHYSVFEDYKNRPESIMTDMITLNRFTFDEQSAKGNDFRGVYHQLFGSNERAIISDQTLQKKLLDLGLIEIEPDPNKTYHFKTPLDAAILNRLGIRYIVLDKELDQKQSAGWELIKSSEGKYLYENNLSTSPIYFIDHGNNIPIRSFKISGNQIIIVLPKSNITRELVATFLNLPDYTAKLDATPTKIFSPPDDLPFIHVLVNPENHILTIRFQRYTWEDLAAIVSFGLIFFSVASLIVLRMPRFFAHDLR